jgi:hypothetical protein
VTSGAIRPSTFYVRQSHDTTVSDLSPSLSIPQFRYNSSWRLGFKLDDPASFMIGIAALATRVALRILTRVCTILRAGESSDSFPSMRSSGGSISALVREWPLTVAKQPVQCCDPRGNAPVGSVFAEQGGVGMGWSSRDVVHQGGRHHADREDEWS